MPDTAASYGPLTLFTPAGERKYLSPAERDAFLKALPVLESPQDRTFCETIFWTGCRPSEALALTPLNIDLDEGLVVIRSLKKRGKLKGRHFRPIPVPRTFLDGLEGVHGIRAAQARTETASQRLWPFSRTTGWTRMKQVMEAAGLSGVKAGARGLRHAYGVHAALKEVPETRIKAWLGHASLETTGVYLDLAGAEDRAIARRMWRDGAP